MGKHVRWTMWNLLVKFSQPKVPKMEHLDTYLFWGKMAFVSMISGNSASTILPYFLKLLSVYIYILGGKVNDVWQHTTYTDSNPVLSQRICAPPLCEDSLRQVAACTWGKQNMPWKWQGQVCQRCSEYIPGKHPEQSLLPLLCKVEMTFSCNLSLKITFKKIGLTLLHVYSMVGSIHMDNSAHWVQSSRNKKPI